MIFLAAGLLGARFLGAAFEIDLFGKACQRLCEAGRERVRSRSHAEQSEQELRRAEVAVCASTVFSRIRSNSLSRSERSCA